MLGAVRTFAVVLGLMAYGCTTEGEPRNAVAVEFQPAPRDVNKDCLEAANLSGLAVPCPSRLPIDARPTVLGGTCEGPPRWIRQGCGKASANAFSSIEYGDPLGVGHIVLVATPGVVSASAVIYSPLMEEDWGPPPRELEKTKVLGFVAGLYEVPEGSTSAFGGHTVAVWSAQDVTYAVGAHGYGAETATVNAELLRGLRVVAPAG